MSRSYAFAYDRAMAGTASTRHDALERTAVAEGASNTPGAIAVPDPQLDEDTVIRRAAAVTVRTLVERWHGYATYDQTRARLLRSAGDEFGASLREVGATTRLAAAGLLAKTVPTEVAEIAGVMLANAKGCHVREAPLMGFDRAARDYTRARVWQACAREIDPSLPEVQPYWD